MILCVCSLSVWRESTVQSFTNLYRPRTHRMSFCRNLIFPKRLAAIFLCAALMPGLAWAFEPFTVRDIQVEGIQRVDAGTIFSYLPVRVGDQFTESQAAEAIQRLYATGFF